MTSPGVSVSLFIKLLISIITSEEKCATGHVTQVNLCPKKNYGISGSYEKGRGLPCSSQTFLYFFEMQLASILGSINLVSSPSMEEIFHES